MQGQLYFRFLPLLLAACCATASADVITDWNDVALQKIRDARTSPPQASRHLAMLHTAMYDAVNGIKAPHQTRHQPYLHRLPGPPMADETAAASAAASQVLNSVWPDDPRFDAAYAAIMEGLPQDRATARGIGYGERVATAILAARAQDGSADTSTYEQEPVPGIWRPTVSFGGVVRPALLPWWGEVEPFGIPAASLFRPPAPLALDSGLYAEEVNEVKALGARTGSERTAEETEIALFWSNGAGTATPPGHWNVITHALSDSLGLTVDENGRGPVPLLRHE
jgi:hypothetical protein